MYLSTTEPATCPDSREVSQARFGRNRKCGGTHRSLMEEVPNNDTKSQHCSSNNLSSYFILRTCAHQTPFPSTLLSQTAPRLNRPPAAQANLFPAVAVAAPFLLNRSVVYIDTSAHATALVSRELGTGVPTYAHAEETRRAPGRSAGWTTGRTVRNELRSAL